MIHHETRGNIELLRMEHGKVNALDLELSVSLAGKLDDLRNATTGAVVLTGSGSVFSAGVDLFRVLEGGPEYVSRFLPALSHMLRTLFEFPRPLIAAINGHAIAGGCIIGLAADYRIMAGGTGRIGIPELFVGVAFPAVALEIVRFGVPAEHLQQVLYGGRNYSAAEAAGLGLIDQAVPADSLLAEALAKGEHFAAMGVVPFGMVKSQLRQPVLQRMAELAAGIDAAVVEHWCSPETHAKIRAYLEKTIRRS